MESAVYIYALCDPDTEAIRYVGSAVAPAERYADHCCGRTCQKNVVWIRELRAAGKRPLLRILEKTTEDCRHQQERYWIQSLHNTGVELNNTADTPGHEIKPFIYPRRNTRNIIMPSPALQARLDAARRMLEEEGYF